MFGIFSNNPKKPVGVFGKPEGVKPAPVVRAAIKETPWSAGLSTTLKVGQRVRGTDTVPDSYKTVNSTFRGTIVDFSTHGVNDVRIKNSSNNKVLRVQKKYLQAL